MPYVSQDGVRIHYQTEGSGPPLVLHHWTFSSLEWWYNLGYVNALQDSAKLILIDARAHGMSGKPEKPGDYSLEVRVRDVCAVLDALGIGRTHFFGYSMGGWIGYGMAIHAADRLCSLVLGGAHPYEQSMQGTRGFLSIGLEQGPSAFADAWEAQVGPLTGDQRNRMLAFDYAAMIQAAGDRASLEAGLESIRTPCLMFAGEGDSVLGKLRQASREIAGTSLSIIPSRGHNAIQDVRAVAALVLSMVSEHRC